MNYVEAIFPEFDREMASTRKVLERVPEHTLDWQARPQLHTIGWNANHLAEIVGWVAGNFMAPSWDYAPIGGAPYQAPKLTSRQEILDLFDRNVAWGGGPEGDRGGERRAVDAAVVAAPRWNADLHHVGGREGW